MISKTLWICTEPTCCENGQGVLAVSLKLLGDRSLSECGVWSYASLTSVCPAASFFNSALSQPMARGGRRPRGEKDRPLHPPPAPAVGSLRLRQESEGVSRCVLSGAPGALPRHGASCSSARLVAAEGTRGHLDRGPVSRAPTAGLGKPCRTGPRRLETFSLETSEEAMPFVPWASPASARARLPRSRATHRAFCFLQRASFEAQTRNGVAGLCAVAVLS